MQQEQMKAKFVLNSNRKHGTGIPVFVLVNQFLFEKNTIIKELCHCLSLYSNANYPCFLSVVNTDYNNLSFREHTIMNSIARGDYAKLESISTKGLSLLGLLNNYNVLDCIKQFIADYPLLHLPVIIFLGDPDDYIATGGSFELFSDIAVSGVIRRKSKFTNWLYQNNVRAYCLTNSQAVKLAFKEMVTGTYMFSEVEELAKCVLNYRPPVKKPEPSKVAVDTISFEIPILANAKFDNED